jgi:hypothetical protein
MKGGNEITTGTGAALVLLARIQFGAIIGTGKGVGQTVGNRDVARDTGGGHGGVRGEVVKEGGSWYAVVREAAACKLGGGHGRAMGWRGGKRPE